VIVFGRMILLRNHFSPTQRTVLNQICQSVELHLSILFFGFPPPLLENNNNNILLFYTIKYSSNQQHHHNQQSTITSIITTAMSSLEAIYTTRRTSLRKHKTNVQDDDNSIVASIVNNNASEMEQQTTNYLEICCCVQGCIYRRRVTIEALLLCESPNCDNSLRLTCFKQHIAAKVCATPGTPGKTLKKNEGTMVDLDAYRSIVGKIMYYATKIAP
jgi:hypothetical protein